MEDINGRNRDYLLTGWYKHSFRFEEGSLGVTLGLIDSTDYLDENAYANDEYNQFMNEVFVNSVQDLLPSYDGGGAVEWETGRWSFRGVAMIVGKNDDDKEYKYLGAMVGYRATIPRDEGNYRLTLAATSEDFLDRTGSDEENLLAAVLSFDQQIGDYWGAFLRVGWQDDDAAVD